MNKRPDFGNDVATLNENVTAAVGDVLQVLQEKRSVSRPAIMKESDARPAEPTANTENPSALEASPVSNPPRRQRSATRSRLATTIEQDEPLENITTRLRQKTNELLTEAALRQRLKKESPATRQSIVEAALTDWFRKHGYSRNRDEETVD